MVVVVKRGGRQEGENDDDRQISRVITVVSFSLQALFVLEFHVHTNNPTDQIWSLSAMTNQLSFSLQGNQSGLTRTPGSGVVGG